MADLVAYQLVAQWERYTLHQDLSHLVFLGLCPIMVDSVIMVSVIVSMATSPITGVASLMRN